MERYLATLSEKQWLAIEVVKSLLDITVALHFLKPTAVAPALAGGVGIGTSLLGLSQSFKINNSCLLYTSDAADE